MPGMRLAILAGPPEALPYTALPVPLAQKSKTTPRQRRQAYGSRLVPGRSVAGLVLPGEGMAYSPIAAAYDKAMRRNAMKGGSLALRALMRHNPLRAGVLRDQPYAQFGSDDPAQMAAINAFNLSLFGSRACLAAPPQRFQLF